MKMLCQDVVDPDDIQTNFNHVGGLKTVKKKLREMIIYPMKFPEVFIQKSALYSPPRGVLLYGKPGCGKTMLAKCLAKKVELCLLTFESAQYAINGSGNQRKSTSIIQFSAQTFSMHNFY